VDLVEKSLVSRAKQRDIHAFAELVELYKDRMVSFLFRMTGNREDAYDLAQDVFLKVYSNFHAFDSNMRFSPWLYRIAQNLAIDFLRRKKKIVYLDEPLSGDDDRVWQLESSDPLPEEVAEFKDLEGALERALLQLNPLYRMVLVLRFVEDLSYEEIANILSVPSTTVKTRLHRAREALRQLLVEQGYYEESQGGKRYGLQ